MKTIQIWFVAVCLISLMPQLAEGSTQTVFSTITNTYPSNVHTSTFVTTSDVVKVVITWTEADTISVASAKSVVNGV